MLPVANCPFAACRLILETEAASAHWRLHRSQHPAFGYGSPMSKVPAVSPILEPLSSDLAYHQALKVVVSAMLIHYRR